MKRLELPRRSILLCAPETDGPNLVIDTTQGVQYSMKVFTEDTPEADASVAIA